MSEMILLAIKPRYAREIYSGRKRLELRRNWPKRCEGVCVDAPVRVLLYECGTGCVTGEFQMWGIEKILYPAEHYCAMARVSPAEWRKYANGAPLYGWRVKDPVKYTVGVPLANYGLGRPPQGWYYLPENGGGRG